MDPYKVLGVQPTDTDEQIKAAYRALVKRYHPDRYPEAAEKEAAAEKLKQINAAYAEIERLRSGKGGAQDGGYENAGYGGFAGDPRYAPVRTRISLGDLQGAEAMLDAMPVQDAEWHYLKGIIYYRRGWMDGARQHLTMAYNMRPDNAEYARAYQTMNEMGGFRNFYRQSSDSDFGACDLCAGMMLLDLCCGRRCC